jgi:hypothetical protein
MSEKQQAPRKTEYDIYGTLVDPFAPVKYVSTKVANAWRAARNYQRSVAFASEEDFRKKDPESDRIIREWSSSNAVWGGTPLVENNDLANLILS